MIQCLFGARFFLRELIWVAMAMTLVGCGGSSSSSVELADKPDHNHSEPTPIPNPEPNPNPDSNPLDSELGWVGSETIRFSGAEWQVICITLDSQDKCDGGKVSVDEGKLMLHPSSQGQIGVVRTTEVIGHFDLLAQIDSAEGLREGYQSPVGIGLLEKVDGTLALDQYTSLFYEPNEEEAFAVHDRQYARDAGCNASTTMLQNNLYDNTCRIRHSDKSRLYQARLTGEFGDFGGGKNNFSIPFSETNGKLRLFRDNLTGFFRYYYGVKKNVLGEEAITIGEMELAPSREWNHDESEKRKNRKYVPVILTRPGVHEPAILESIEIVARDMDDVDTSENFALAERNFTWSGFNGEGIVISFDQNTVDANHKLVFWSETNNVPVFKINDQLLFSYEFVELWADDRKSKPGAFEPMSDDLRWRNTLEILENNEVRKVVRWRYPIVNPAYHTFSNNLESLPFGEEVWTIYPDATAYRHTRYEPDENAGHVAPSWFEFSEFIAIAGTQSSPADHAVSGDSLHMYGLSGESLGFIPEEGSNVGAEQADEWKETIVVADFYSMLGGEETTGIYSVYAHPSYHPKVSKSSKLHYDVTWHSYKWEFSHWPVSKLPFEYHDKSFAWWEEQVSHASLASIQVSGGGNIPTEKYWTTLVGLSNSNDVDILRARASSWLYVSEPTALSGCDFLDFSKQTGTQILSLQENSKKCEFTLHGSTNGYAYINPVIKVNDFAGELQGVFIDGSVFNRENYRSAKMDDQTLIIWLNAKLDIDTKIRIELVD